MIKLIAWDKINDVAVDPERFPNDKEWHAKFVDGVLVAKKQYNAPKSTADLLIEAKTARIVRVKTEAGERISALDWQLQRADRHTELNKTPKKARALVLTAQQKIEDDSDLAEEAINLLGTPEDVQAFNW